MAVIWTTKSPWTTIWEVLQKKYGSKKKAEKVFFEMIEQCKRDEFEDRKFHFCPECHHRWKVKCPRCKK